MHDSDGVEEAAGQTVRVAVTAAARVGQTLARVRQQHQQRAAEESAARAAALTERMQAELSAARVAYRGLEDPQWWNTARAEDVAASYRTAVAWRDVDPEAAQAQQRIATEVKTRYGVDVDGLDHQQLGSELSAAAHEVAHRDTLDVAEAGTLLAAADRADQAAAPGPAAEGEEPWDSARRRAATAERLSATVGDAQAVDARMRADVAQAKPPAEATREVRAGSKARPSRGEVGRARDRQRDLSR